ncbi:MAG: LysM peptidoglycan-binding domain-containing protein [Oscillospiraceae bacterium]|nr:LysM peptidoglycan-binding domain-containing protein [Oscillospiraceae bacterium]
MVIHVVEPGETLTSIAAQYQVPISQIAEDNELASRSNLAVGQALVIQFPLQTHTVQAGESLYSISQRYQISQRQLYRNNPVLGGEPTIYPGQTLVISYEGEQEGVVSVSGYAYPFISKELLQSVIPYLTYLIPFTYGLRTDGTLIPLGDEVLLAMAEEGGAGALMNVSTLDEEGHFSDQLARAILEDINAQDRLIANILAVMAEKGYAGLDIDFEYIPTDLAGAYPLFLERVTSALNPRGFTVMAALAPKTWAGQQGVLFEAHDYRAIGSAVNEVLLMTYEWGYAAGPPMAVAPVPEVRRVIEYALTEFSGDRIWMGIPTYGYDWTLPFVEGESRARSLSPQEAIALALRYGVAIEYDSDAQSPFFYYQDEEGITHVVWFEDARSIRAKLALIPEYGLKGAGYWNLMRHFPQNWRILNALYTIREP